MVPPPPPLRCLTFDVEEYFHIEAAHGWVSLDARQALPARVDANVHRLVECLARYGRQATFFVLADVARRHPDLVPFLAAAGHEIASHGSGHDRLHRLNPASFRQDAGDSRKILQDQSGQAVRGYRAPTFSLVPATRWAIDVLVQLGFEYDASIFPVRHPSYGVPSAPLSPFYLESCGGARLLEVPPLVWTAIGRRWPVAGGGYFRLLPEWFMQRGLAQAAQQERPAILYFHPWEFDPGTPRMPLPLTNRIRTYTGLGQTMDRLCRLVAQPADWRTIASAMPVLEGIASCASSFRLKLAA